MKVVVFRTYEERQRGLQHMAAIPDDTAYVFTGPFVLGQFHSRNVPEPFDIAFLSVTLHLIEKRRMVPPEDVVQAPIGTMYVVEAKAGVLDRFTI
jgi:uncharacterized membrane protein (UPF0127 family)